MLQRQLKWQLEACPKTIPAIEAFFEFPSHSIENGHKSAKSNTSENTMKVGRLLLRHSECIGRIINKR